MRDPRPSPLPPLPPPLSSSHLLSAQHHGDEALRLSGLRRLVDENVLQGRGKEKGGMRHVRG